MKGQPNRLAAATAGPFSGSAIDRNRPLQFRLDGRTINGFAGDTILSAVLAAGIDTAGRRTDGPIALSTRYAPAIVAAALAKDPQRALAMERTLATPGAEYLTLAPSLRRAVVDGVRGLVGTITTLGLDLQRPAAMSLPWMGCIGAVETPADLIVVGGGVAGMSAALAGHSAGLRVLLLEASPRLGGLARLFGTIDGEETAEDSLERLGTALAQADGITVVTHAAVYAARSGVVRVHITDKADSMPSARVVDVHARHIVVASGARERLPLFAGNRLPGIAGVREAYDLADNYGVWCGQSALFATSSSVAYRLAMRARDAGIAVPRIIDARPQPQSRFIEYSKAYGITLAAGTIITDARPAPQGRGLAVTPQLSMAGFTRTEPVLTVDRLVACGGWQPELSLWQMAGGQSQWNAQTARLEAHGGVDGIALAGNAAGYRGHHACLHSGQAAIDELLGRSAGRVAEREVDPLYETPDAPAPIAPADDSAIAPSFLDGGRGSVALPQSVRSRWPEWLPRPAKPPRWSLANVPQALEATDIAAGVQLGLIAPESAAVVAQERVAMVAIAPLADERGEPGRGETASLVPRFLAGRFGPAPQLWCIRPSEARKLESGALIQPDSDATDPARAIGVVLRQIEGNCVALIAASHAEAAQTAAVRDHGRATVVQLVARYQSD